MSAAEESLKRAEELLERLEQTRARLESTTDPDAAIDILGELEVVGVPTTAGAARDILRTEEFATGRYSTSFLEEAGRRLPALAG